MPHFFVTQKKKHQHKHVGLGMTPAQDVAGEGEGGGTWEGEPRRSTRKRVGIFFEKNELMGSRDDARVYELVCFFLKKKMK